MNAWVLLRPGALLRAGAEVVAAHAYRDAVPMRFVARHGDDVVLEAPPLEQLCYRSPYAGPFAVRVTARVEDLLPVVGHAVKRRWWDGSRLRIDPGLVVSDGAVTVGELSIPVHASRRFRPNPHTPVEREDFAHPDADIVVVGPYERPLDGLYAYARHDGPKDAGWLTEELDCAQVVWRVVPRPDDGTTRLYADIPTGIGGLIGRRGGAGGGWYAPGGSPLWWPDGLPAGSLRVEFQVQEAEIQGDRWCTRFGPWDGALTVCGATADLDRHWSPGTAPAGPWEFRDPDFPQLENAP